MIDVILDKIAHFLHKDQYLDTYLKNIISDKTGFKAKMLRIVKVKCRQMMTC